MFEKMKEIWKKWFGKKGVETSLNETMDVSAKTKEKTETTFKNSSLLENLEACLFDRFDFRFNVLTEQTEYAPKGTSIYELVDQRVLNTLCLVARKNGINCWDKDVSRLLLSQEIADYHPFLDYMDNLPDWDGIDRVSELASRVSDTPLWIEGFHRWMLGMTAQWMAMDVQCANAVAPLLVSTEQGRCKSTFCSILLPTELQRFYIDKFDITSVSGCEQKLSLFGLINMDEFDRYGIRTMATLKNLMQLKKLTFRKSHRAYYSQLPRIASFIGTSNQKELLTDTTGSRRFLCVEVKQFISSEPLQHKQLYAQLKHELEAGLPTYLNKYEEAAWQRHNRKFYQESLLEDVFHSCFRLLENVAEGEWLTAAHIFKIMVKHNSTALRGVSAKRLSYHLRGMGLESKHTQYGNVYRIVFRESSL